MADGVRAAGIRFGGALGPMAAECAESKYGRVPHREKHIRFLTAGKTAEEIQMKKYTQEAFAKLPLKGKLREFSDFMDKCGRPEDERDMSCRYVFQACTSVGITVEQLALHTTGWSINDIIGFYFDQDGKADNIACDGEIVKALKRFRVFMLCCKNGSFDWFHLEVTEKHWLTIGELVDYSSAGKELENDKPDRVLTITIRGRKCEIVEKDFVKPYQRRYPPFDINDRNYHDLLGLIFFQ